MSTLNHPPLNSSQAAVQPAEGSARSGATITLSPSDVAAVRNREFFAPTLIAMAIQIASTALLAGLLSLLISLRPGDGGEDGGGSGNGASGDGGRGEAAAVGPGSGPSDNPAGDGSSAGTEEIMEVKEKSGPQKPQQRLETASAKEPVSVDLPEKPMNEFVVQDLTPPLANEPQEQPAAQEPGEGGGDGFSNLEDRLKQAGAKTGDVQISLAWNNGNDLDLHVQTPGRETIWYNDRISSCQGELDVDMNAGGPRSNEPVENVYWPVGASPNGKYRVYVHHFANHGGRDPTKFQVTIKVKGKSRSFTGTVRHGGEKKLVHEFTFP